MYSRTRIHTSHIHKYTDTHIQHAHRFWDSEPDPQTTQHKTIEHKTRSRTNKRQHMHTPSRMCKQNKDTQSRNENTVTYTHTHHTKTRGSKESTVSPHNGTRTHQTGYANDLERKRTRSTQKQHKNKVANKTQPPSLALPKYTHNTHQTGGCKQNRAIEPSLA